ncbi:hypothetical protein ACIQ6R_13040 [Streptomyces sp. NPDC096048]|uniref:hypothetical protein n=1 Tax=Streptomyces sp. NPDC096048 TaxID=3366072 RepID=UPI003802E403
MSAPLVVNTRDGACWTRRTVTPGGIALYAPEAVKTCPEFVMATLEDLAAHGIQGSADALPMPVGPVPMVSEEELDAAFNELRASLRLRLALASAQRGRRELRAELHTAQAHGRTFLEQRNAHAKELLELRARLSAAPSKLSAEQRDAIVRHLGEAKPATDSLIVGLAKTVQDRREHEHPTWEDLYCLNLVSWAGERMGPVLRRLLDAEARVAELEAAQGTVYRASHDSIPMGLYRTAAEARKHCETDERRSWLTGTTLSFDWIEDEEDGVAELVATAGQNEESTTNYVVEALEVASEYDPEADE